jgi:hypothetical protein
LKEENKKLSISIFRPHFVQPESYKKKGKSKISDNEDKDQTSSSTDKNKGKGKEKGKGKTPGKTGEKILCTIYQILIIFCVDNIDDVNVNMMA